MSTITNQQLSDAIAHARSKLLAEGWKIGAVVAPRTFQLRRAEQDPWLHAALIVRLERNSPDAYRMPDGIDLFVEVQRQGGSFTAEVFCVSPQAKAVTPV
jgi:hypothetical protein